MVRASLIFVAAVCFIATCYSDPVLDVVPMSERNAAVSNSYFITTWDLVAEGISLRPVQNSAQGVAALNFLNGTQTVAIVVHGRDSSAFSEFANTLWTVLVENDRSGAVIVVDWSAIANSGYNQARSQVQQVAQDLSNFIALLEGGQKLDRNRLHLIGFDLGAHVVGIASRIPPSRAKKITALSPAGEGWDVFSLRLRSTDAEYVEVIHTDAVGNRAFGMVVVESVGTLDFFPNGATRQPGCSLLDSVCNHNRSWQLFVATVHVGGHLAGIRCDTLTQALSRNCTGPEVAVMGTGQLSKPDVGMYWLNTGGVWPYAA